MDPNIFEKYSKSLLHRAYRCSITERKHKQLQEKGQPVPKLDEEGYVYKARPKMRSCDDCNLVSENTIKHYVLEHDKDNKPYWRKRCDECGKIILLKQKK
jgi:hypothetical protein